MPRSASLPPAYLAEMADDGLSAYERQRIENIAKNKQVLESLGLLNGSGLIQRNKGGGGAIQRKAKPREPRPVVAPSLFLVLRRRGSC